MRKSGFKTSDFDYVLPSELIAQQPLAKRSQSRMLCLEQGRIVDSQFVTIVDRLCEGDLLVLNDTRVFPARLYAQKKTGGKVEIFAERVLDQHRALVQIKANRKLSEGAKLVIADALEVEVIGREGHFFLVQFLTDQPAFEIFQKYGHVPLPPYIQRADEQDDLDRYQTVYADRLGAVAAPTAGLHFDQATLDQLKRKGVQIAHITLHVGAGTFQPVKVESIEQHTIHHEYAEVNENVCEAVRACKQQGGRVVAVGTTSVRALETAARGGNLRAYAGETDLFITPGFEFSVVDGLLTNFHLPQSTLLMLVAALAGYDLMMEAYRHAVTERYRFYSYGDAMLILP